MPPDPDQARIFGSWADRYNGEPGRFPQDVDLLVIGSVDQFELATMLSPVSRKIVYEPDRFSEDIPLLTSSSQVIIK